MRPSSGRFSHQAIFFRVISRKKHAHEKPSFNHLDFVRVLLFHDLPLRLTTFWGRPLTQIDIVRANDARREQSRAAKVEAKLKKQKSAAAAAAASGDAGAAAAVAAMADEEDDDDSDDDDDEEDEGAAGGSDAEADDE